MIYILLASLLSIFTHAAPFTVAQVCGDNKFPGNAIVDPLERVSKEEWCVVARCDTAKERITRSLCVKQRGKKESEVNPHQYSITQRDLYETDNSSGSRGSLLDSIELYKTDSCFQYCKPEGKTIGREKPSCMECLLKAPRSGDKYELKGKGVTLYKGQQCFYECKPIGRENDMPVYSQKCLECAGVSTSQKAGQYQAQKHYMIDGFNKCLEFIEYEYNKVFAVPMELCKKAPKVYGTVFKRDSGYSVKTLIFGEKPACREIDDFSYGGYLNRETLDSKCPDGNMNDNDRNSGKDTPTKSGSSGKTSGTKANKQ